MRNPVVAVFALATLLCLNPTAGRASLSLYSQDFESIALPSPGGLLGGDWLVYGNVYTPDMVRLYGYGAFPAPNDGAAFCAIVTGDTGQNLGLRHLSVFSDYNNSGAHSAGNIVEANVYQERTIEPEDVGHTWVFSFMALGGNLAGASTAAAFIKTLDPAAGYALTNFREFALMGGSTYYYFYYMNFTIDPSLSGQVLQFGFLSRATRFEASAMFYDDVVFEPAAISTACLRWPQTLTVSSGPTSGPVYGEVCVPYVSDALGPMPGLVAELGYGPDGSDPTANPSLWKWEAASFSADLGNSEQYAGTLSVTSPAGTYDYCLRFSYESGPWVYGDGDGSYNGYSPAQAGSLVVLESAATSITGPDAAGLRLYPNQPNPFNPLTTIRFDLPAAGQVRLAVYDLAGRLVRVLVAGDIPAGSHQAVWDGRDSTGRSSPSGTYLARLVEGGKVEVVRMGLVR